MVHELACNAVKYGALSVLEGRLSIEWSIDTRDARLNLKWTETNGPQPAVSTKKGFGSELISRQLRYELDGELDYDFAQAGLRVTIKVPSDDHLFSVPEGAHESTHA
jgi:two-component system CheB/CheR fusion protein